LFVPSGLRGLLSPPVPVRVKICGITNVADAVAAVDAGARWVSVFENSKRNVSPWPRENSRVAAFRCQGGVFVNAPNDFVRGAIETSGIDTLQFHARDA
jgi:phosphoribosylanthranilate isomerase